jgi:hypothetical protein
MKRTILGIPVRVSSLLLIGLICLLASIAVTGCSSDSDSEDIWLDDVQNPFIGTWTSGVTADGTTLTLTGKTDGTFAYTMEGVPEEMGLPDSGTGAYLIKGDKMVSLFDFGLVKAILFKAVDNDTLLTTEFVLVNGKTYTGEETYFTRVGAASSTTDQPTVLADNDFLGGKWAASIPEPDIPNYSYESEWEFRKNGTITCVFLGLGPAFGLDEEDAPFEFSYVIFDNTLVVLTESPEGNEIQVFSFAQQNPNTINVTELVVANSFVTEETGSDPVPFTHIP